MPEIRVGNGVQNFGCQKSESELRVPLERLYYHFFNCTRGFEKHRDGEMGRRLHVRTNPDSSLEHLAIRVPALRVALTHQTAEPRGRQSSDRTS